MKIFTAIVVALITGLFILAALSEPDSAYGQWPVLMLATTASSLLVLAYFAIYAWLRKDRYILGAILFLTLDAGIKAVMLPGSTNPFGIFWSVVIILSGFGLPLLIFGIIRMTYVAVSTRTNPFSRPANTD